MVIQPDHSVLGVHILHHPPAGKLLNAAVKLDEGVLPVQKGVETGLGLLQKAVQVFIGLGQTVCGAQPCLYGGGGGPKGNSGIFRCTDRRLRQAGKVGKMCLFGKSSAEEKAGRDGQNQQKENGGDAVAAACHGRTLLSWDF